MSTAANRVVHAQDSLCREGLVYRCVEALTVCLLGSMLRLCMLKSSAPNVLKHREGIFRRRMKYGVEDFLRMCMSPFFSFSFSLFFWFTTT